ncbi:MAG: CHAP domain-containing protein [Clostridiales bacterium]|nr:CHAP domain-containing protein [Clostridiales bacterium]
MFVPRLTRPEAGNKFYIRKVSGGYSNAIQGKPTDPLCDVLSNCVGYAYGRFHEIANCTAMDMFDPVNAENIFANAQQHGLKTGSEPRLGALIVWQKGATLKPDDGAGHVAVVERIDSDGSILTSESGYGAGTAFWTTLRKPPFAYRSEYKLLGFVYQPEGPVNPFPEPTRVLKRGCDGDDVKWLQYELHESGYLRESEIDGDFGNITFGGLLAFQFDCSIAVDGVCGPQTREMLKQR